ncbi:MAG: hypothetical protein QNJ63_28170 [Calothrix sp. MO_192.B10]|nr:hypothetical protein [Calothrix sp. MO_192.B10]
MENQEKQSQELTTKVLERQKQEEIMHDILILLDNLITREEATVKLIVNSLYDVGSVNLINQKFRSRTFNKTLKLISRVSKPAFKIIAWRWVKKNSPRLITNWMQRKVAFEQAKPEIQQAQVAIAPQKVSTNVLPPAQERVQEVKYLRSQVKLLVSLLIGTVTVFGGSFAWMGYEMQRSHQQTIQEIRTQMKIMEANRNPR